MKYRYTTKQLMSLYEGNSSSKKKTKGAKPDFLDADGDGNRKESMKKAMKDKKSKGKKTPMKENFTFAETVRFILEK